MQTMWKEMLWSCDLLKKQRVSFTPTDLTNNDGLFFRQDAGPNPAPSTGPNPAPSTCIQHCAQQSNPAIAGSTLYGR